MLLYLHGDLVFVAIVIMPLFEQIFRLAENHNIISSTEGDCERDTLQQTEKMQMWTNELQRMSGFIELDQAQIHNEHWFSSPHLNS